MKPIDWLYVRSPAAAVAAKDPLVFGMRCDQSGCQMIAVTAATPFTSQQNFRWCTCTLALNLEAVFNLTMNSALGRRRDGRRCGGRGEIQRDGHQQGVHLKSRRDCGEVV